MLGVCGGYQMLGRRIADPQGIEGASGAADGLGLLDVETVMTAEKTLRPVAGRLSTGGVFAGYEMHVGETAGPARSRPFLIHADGRLEGAMSPDGKIMGAYVHGLFDKAEARDTLLQTFGRAGVLRRSRVRSRCSARRGGGGPVTIPGHRRHSKDRRPLSNVHKPFITPDIVALDPELAKSLRAKVDGLAKPPGALGRLEGLAIRIGLIQARLDPKVDQVRAYVFAGDHGLNSEGVSAYPSAVTAAMVSTFLAGKASVNALAKACGVEVRVVDAGVDAVFAPNAMLIDAKVRRGTRNAAVEAALSLAEVEQALAQGVALAGQAAEEGVDALIPGEMGIGNTASAALIMHRLLPLPLSECIGVGAGHDTAGLERKRAVLARASARTDAATPLEVLCEFGGLEIVMMAGLILGGAARRRVMIIDGFISSVAALAAIRLAPGVKDYCIFAHSSAERGHAALLNALEVEPLLQLEMRLGEGTGGVLAAPLVRSAAAMLTEIASLEDVLSGRL